MSGEILNSPRDEHAPARGSRWRWRYSLRFLLLAMIVVSAGLVWMLLPTWHARRYVAALAAKDYRMADSMCVADVVFPGNWVDSKHFEPRAVLKPPTWQDLWRGRRELYVGISYGDGGGIATRSVECVATREGIEVGMFMP